MFDNKKEKIKSDKIRFVFVGHLDKIRNVSHLFEAINNLKKSNPDLSEKVEFVFYGDMYDDDKNYVINNGLNNIISIRSSISYEESLKEMINANWLIHVDGDISKVINHNIFFAAKLVDYFGSRTNILAITMEDGDVVNVLKKYRALILPYDVSKIQNSLYKIIYDNYKIHQNKHYIKRFDSINVAKTFDKKIIGRKI